MARRSANVQNENFEDVIEEMIFFKDLVVPCTIELGRTSVTVRALLELEPGSLVELPKSAGETLDIYANNYLIMKGEISVIEDAFGLRITEIINPWKRV